MFFHQIAFVIGVLTSSLGGGWSRNFWVCCRGRVSCRGVSVVPHHESGQGGVGQGVTEAVVWDVSGGVWLGMLLEGVAEDVAWTVVGGVDGGAWSQNEVWGVAEGVVGVSLVVVGRRVVEGEGVAGDVWLCEGECWWWRLIVSGCGWKALPRVLLGVAGGAWSQMSWRVSPMAWIGCRQRRL